MKTKVTTHPALQEFIKRVAKSLISKGWNIRDDCEIGMPVDIMDTTLARSIIEHSDLLLSENWKKNRIEELKRELESLSS
jgi:S-adenosylhomocysteine hydrolase